MHKRELVPFKRPLSVSLHRKGVAGNPGSLGQKGEFGYPGPYVSNLHFSYAYELVLQTESHLCQFHLLYVVSLLSQGDKGPRGPGVVVCNIIIILLG